MEGREGRKEREGKENEDLSELFQVKNKSQLLPYQEFHSASTYPLV
jgi:hypothetical protein